MKNKKGRKSFKNKFISEINKKNESNLFYNDKNYLSFQQKIHLKIPNIFLMFYFMAILFSKSLSKKNTIYLKKLNNACDMNLRVDKGEQKIFDGSKFSPKVIYNNTEIHPDIYGYYPLPETEESNIILRFDSLPTDCSSIFYGNSDLLSISFENCDLSQVESMSSAFRDCWYLTSIDFTNVNTESLKETDYMFSGCKVLEKLDLSYFNTIHVTDMRNMFEECEKLISINLRNFDTSSVKYMDDMFYECYSLTSLDLKNFDTQKVESSSKMFSDCISLLYLDLSNFQTASNTQMGSMFAGCSSLKSLNIDNFIVHSTITSIEYMFYECNSLISLKLEKFILDGTNVPDFLPRTNEDIKYCFIDSSTSLLMKDNFPALNMTNINCSDICFHENKKIINGTAKCTLNCVDEDNYNLEYNGICYNNCPEGTNQSGNECIVLTSDSQMSPIDISGSQLNTDDSCLLNNNDFSKDNINKIINNIRSDSQMCKFDLFKSFEENKNDILIRDNNKIYQITSLYNQKNKEYNNISSINLGECETKLKEHYSINDDEKLLIFKMDYKDTGYSIPIVEYEVYNLETNQFKLNLSICEDLKITINIPVDIDEDNLFKYNSSSAYYNDKCFPYTSDNNTDIILEDRRKEYIDYKLSLCENNCEYKKYDSNNKKAVCECNIKKKFREEIKIDSNKFLNNFKNIKETINLEVVKCYKLLITKDAIKFNIGNYIMMAIILPEIVLLILFKIKGYKKLLDKINEIKNSKKEVENNNILNENKIIKDNEKPKIKKIIKKKKKKKKKISVDNDIKIYPKEIKNNPPKNDGKESSNRMKINIEDSKKNTSKLFINKENTILNNQKNDIFSNNNNINNIINKPINEYNDYELNSLNYEKALEIDKRTYCQYYSSLIKIKHLIIFTFYTNTDYNSRIIKLSLFIFSFALFLTINALFFTDSTMHKIYENHGIFNFLYQLPKILYSTIISAVINAIVKFLSLSEKNILILKYEKNNVDIISMKIIKILKIKILLFYILILLFLIFFWFYLSCFCAVYSNTQFHLIKDTLISFGLSLIYPFGINLLPGIFRISALSGQNKTKKCLYIISKVIQLF